MPALRTIPFNFGVFSITFTCAGWLPLIELVNGYDLIYNWFGILQARGHQIIGYVIMPNHVHVIIAFKETDTSINTIIGNGKRFMAYGIIDRLKELSDIETLSHLARRVEPGRRMKNKQHDVWELSFDWKFCTSASFMKQKLDYYHINPCKGKWSLAKTALDYLHSSAQFYHTGVQGLFPVTNYMELFDLGLLDN